MIRQRKWKFLYAFSVSNGDVVGVEVSSERRTFLMFTVFELSDVTLKPIQSGTDFDLSSTDILLSLYLKASTEPNYADFDILKPLNLQGDTTFTYLAPGTWYILISSSETSSTTVRFGFESTGKSRCSNK